MITKIHNIYEEDTVQLKTMADLFWAESKQPGTLEFSLFLSKWKTLMDVGIAAMWKRENNEKKILGVFGATLYPHLFSNVKVATEVFWFVDPAYRNSASNLHLVYTYEQWAVANGAKLLRMAHTNLMPERLKEFYHRRGYASVEEHFEKEVA